MPAKQASGEMDIFLSIIVIAHNEEAYISECLESILKQCTAAMELIVIDDYSNDATHDILIARQCQFPALRVSHNAENMGAGLSRNVGIGMAKGAYLMFVDGDDTLVDGCLNEIFVKLKKEQVDILIFNHNLVYEGGLVLAARQHEILKKASLLSSDAQKQWLLKLYQIACNKVYRADFIQRHALYFSRGNYEDTAYAYKALLRADRISVSMRAYYNYRQRTGTAPYRPNKKEARVKQSFLIDRYKEIFEFLADNDLQQFSAVVYSKMLIQFNAVLGERYDQEDKALLEAMRSMLLRYRPDKIVFPTIRSRAAYWCFRLGLVRILIGMNRLYSFYRNQQYKFEVKN